MRLSQNLPPWTLDVAKCPCDLHFLRYLSRKGLNKQTIFHFGTGEHHLIGRENVRFERPNEILGITASRGEYDRYMDMVIDNPIIGRYYKVLFMDIYTLNQRLMPKFDLITMFHFSRTRRAYATRRRAKKGRLDSSRTSGLPAETWRKNIVL